jgi:hypothetical protein
VESRPRPMARRMKSDRCRSCRFSGQVAPRPFCIAHAGSAKRHGLLGGLTLVLF